MGCWQLGAALHGLRLAAGSCRLAAGCREVALAPESLQLAVESLQLACERLQLAFESSQQAVGLVIALLGFPLEFGGVFVFVRVLCWPMWAMIAC